MHKKNDAKEKTAVTGLEVAVIGMAGRFPDAKNIDRFWENLKNGVESVSFFSDSELKDVGIPSKLLTDPNFVRARAILEDEDYASFDSPFFGYTPQEVDLMDPQIRLFHEIAWEALEDGGYEPHRYEGLIGLYAGAEQNYYWEGQCIMSGKSRDMGEWAAVQYMDKDFFTLRVSYALNLRGPSSAIYTACSTSLTAVHLACQALLNGECDMALAGGIHLTLPTKGGYPYQEGMINSPDGHCRAFDAAGKGAVAGDGGGIVLLKPLEDALEDGDNIYAVVKGTAINNDGTRKGGFSAPSVDGQAEVIQAALQTAHVEPETIGFIEAHGTATILGDPIEVQALKVVFKAGKKRACAVGTVKSNMGHLFAGAGVAGFIKAVLALKYRLIPPSLHFETPNPGIDFENSPFYVNTELKEWRPGKNPLRAGVSSLGMGGANAHVVLEEWRSEPGAVERDYNLLLLSARTPSILEKMTENLADYLKGKSRNPVKSADSGPVNFSLADAAYTLQVGRRAFKYRRMLVCTDVNEAVDLLASASSPDSGQDQGKVKTLALEENNRPVVFMFSGLGSQYVDMGRELYEKETVFREEMDRCFEIVKALMGYDIKGILYPPGVNRSDRPHESSKSYPENLNQPEIAQVVVFIFEYALAALLMKWGISPRAMIGYSFGEYVAACTAGVFSLEEALKLVVARGELIKELPGGGMLSVPLPVKELEPLLDAHDELSIAIDNGPSCVVAGPTAAVDAFETQMKEKRYMCMRVENLRAIHSPMMAPAAGKFKDYLRRTDLKPPKIQYISNVTGTWVTPEETADPEYWVAHLKQTVRFADGMKRLLKEFPNCILVEIGPGRDIGTLALRHIESVAGDDSGKKNRYTVMNLVRHPRRQVSDVYFLLNRIGRLWLCGQNVDWSAFHRREERRRISLPTYPFERRRYWIGGDSAGVRDKRSKNAPDQGTPLPGNKDITEQFYIPTWERSIIPGPRTPRNPDPAAQNHCLVFFNEKETIGPLLVSALKQAGCEVIEVTPGARFSKINHRGYAIDPDNSDDYHALFRELVSRRVHLQWIVHLWGVTGKDPGETGPDRLVEPQDSEFYRLLYLAKAVGKVNPGEDRQIFVITDRVQDVIGDEPLCPGKALVIGPVKVLPQEFPGIRCRNIDIVSPESGSPEEERLVGQLLDEFSIGSVDSVVAYRGNLRWAQTFKSFFWDEATEKNSTPKLREGGVYLVTGGTGNIGLILARYLAEEARAKLILTGRSQFPAPRDWDKWRAEHGENDALSKKIEKLKAIEETGAEVLVFSADVADRQRMREVIARAEQQFGPVNGVFHAAGIVSDRTFRSIRDIKEEECRAQFRAKIDGTLVMEELFRGKELDFCCLISSISTILGGLGYVAYVAANSFMDAYVKKHNRFDSNRWISVDWDGMGEGDTRTAFHRILSLGGIDQVVFSNTGNLSDRIALWVNPGSAEEENKVDKGGESSSHSHTLQPRPSLSNSYTPPRNQSEQEVADIWQALFGMGPLGIYDDFVELGGDSLKAITMIGRVQKALNVDVPLMEFFHDPTIEKLARYIADARVAVGNGDAVHGITPVEKMEYYSLSPAQKRLFVQQQVAPKSTAYNEVTAITLEGNVSVSGLEDLFKILIQRHESLRTSFEMVGEEPVQRIHHRAAFEIECFDSSTGDHSSTILNFVRPFDLSRAPLLRAGLLKIDTHRQILLIDMHHLVMDGRSIEILLDELVLLYKRYELPELEIQYKDFSEWQRRFFENQQDVMTRQKDYWLSKFKDRVPLLKLPIDYPRPTIRSFEGSRLSFELDPGRTKILKELASKEELTLFMLLLGMFSVFLSKLSGQEDIVIGSPILGRNHPDVQAIIGMFVNTLVLRSFPAGSKRFPEFLKEMKETLLEALDNQDYPFDELVEDLGVRRDAGRNPVFDVTFAMLNTRVNERGPREQTQGQKQETKGPAFQEYMVAERMSKFDLGLEAMENDNNILLTFVYCTKLFKKESVEQFVLYFNEIVDFVGEDPNIHMKDIIISHGLFEVDSTMPEVDFKL